MAIARWLAWSSWVVVCGGVAGCSEADAPDEPSPDEAVGSATDELRWLRFCGGSRGVGCPEQQYCRAWLGHCPDDRHFGRCATRPEACTKEYRPVCGCDGLSYPNACEAAAAGVSVDHLGECEPDGEFCGGIAGFPCPEGQTCVDDPGDDCDPSSGGADCGGICVTGIACGAATCGPGLVCCNPVMGICTEPGRVCIQ